MELLVHVYNAQFNNYNALYKTTTCRNLPEHVQNCLPYAIDASTTALAIVLTSINLSSINCPICWTFDGTAALFSRRLSFTCGPECLLSSNTKVTTVRADEFIQRSHCKSLRTKCAFLRVFMTDYESQPTQLSALN